MRHSTKYQGKTNRNWLACVSHSRNIAILYPVCSASPGRRFQIVQRAMLSSWGTGVSGLHRKAQVFSSYILFISHSMFHGMHICLRCHYFCPIAHFFIDSLNSHVHWESHRLGLKHREVTLMNVLFTYLLFLSVAFSAGSGYLFHLAGQLRIRWRMEITGRLPLAARQGFFLSMAKFHKGLVGIGHFGTKQQKVAAQKGEWRGQCFWLHAAVF